MSSLFDENDENEGLDEDDDDNQKKSYLALNVFVETIFIVGEFMLIISNTAQLNSCGPEFFLAKFWDTLVKIIWQLISKT